MQTFYSKFYSIFQFETKTVSNNLGGKWGLTFLCQNTQMKYYTCKTKQTFRWNMNKCQLSLFLKCFLIIMSQNSTTNIRFFKHPTHLEKSRKSKNLYNFCCGPKNRKNFLTNAWAIKLWHKHSIAKWKVCVKDKQSNERNWTWAKNIFQSDNLVILEGNECFLKLWRKKKYQSFMLKLK